MYGVAKARIVIPASFSRLQKFGYCNTMIMVDVWKLIKVKDPNTPQESQTSEKIPVVFVSRVIDEIS